MEDNIEQYTITKLKQKKKKASQFPIPLQVKQEKTLKKTV